jgi:hypothetical protein
MSVVIHLQTYLTHVKGSCYEILEPRTKLKTFEIP